MSNLIDHNGSTIVYAKHGLFHKDKALLSVVNVLGTKVHFRLSPLMALDLAKTLISDVPVGPDSYRRDQIVDAVSFLIEDEEGRPVREAREKILADLGITSGPRPTRGDLNTLLDHIQALKENPAND